MAGLLTGSTGKIDVGGFGLFADVQGIQVAGAPTVVFDHGGGEDHTAWQAADVQQAIAQSRLTVSYDRAGQGQSDESNLPKTAAEQARQLHELLHNGGLPPPYLLVSHSIAGFNARVFADLYPEELYGVVLVDSSHEGMNEGTWQPITIVDVSSSGEMSYAEFTQSVDQVEDPEPRSAAQPAPHRAVRHLPWALPGRREHRRRIRLDGVPGRPGEPVGRFRPRRRPARLGAPPDDDAAAARHRRHLRDPGPLIASDGTSIRPRRSH